MMHGQWEGMHGACMRACVRACVRVCVRACMHGGQGVCMGGGQVGGAFLPPMQAPHACTLPSCTSHMGGGWCVCMCSWVGHGQADGHGVETEKKKIT